MRESGGDHSAVTGGTRVLFGSDQDQITSNPATFLDRMIALVEGAERREEYRNEIALNIMIAGLTIIFLFAVVTLVSLCAVTSCSSPAPVRRRRLPSTRPCWSA